MDEDIQSTESLPGKRIRRKMLRSWSGEIAYILEEEESSENSSVLPNKNDPSNKRKLLSSQKPLNKTANIDADCASIGLQATKPTTIPSYGKFAQGHKINSSNKHKFLKKLHSEGTNTTGVSNLNVCKNCQKYKYYNENNFKQCEDNEMSDVTFCTGQEKLKKSHREEVIKTPNKRSSVKRKTYDEKPKIDYFNEDDELFVGLTPPNTRKASVCANLGKPLRQFIGGTLDTPVLYTSTNQRKHDKKVCPIPKSSRHKSEKIGKTPYKCEQQSTLLESVEEGKENEDIIYLLPPLLQPPISCYSRKYDETDRYDKEDDISNEFSKQRKCGNSQKSGFETTYQNDTRYLDKSQNMKFPSDIITDDQFEPAIRTQAVDFTPFLTQLLESCLKIPYALNNIRSSNNTFVSDLQNWKMTSQNIIDKNNAIPEPFELNTTTTTTTNNNNNNNNEPEEDDCKLCKQCHDELETLLQALNNKHHQSDISANESTSCNCPKKLFEKGSFSVPNQLPAYLAQCHIPYHQKMLAKILQMQKTSNHRCQGCDISTGLSELELIRNEERKPRCACIKEESSDEGECDCSHCSSCCSILESNY